MDYNSVIERLLKIAKEKQAALDSEAKITNAEKSIIDIKKEISKLVTIAALEQVAIDLEAKISLSDDKTSIELKRIKSELISKIPDIKPLQDKLEREIKLLSEAQKDEIERVQADLISRLKAELKDLPSGARVSFVGQVPKWGKIKGTLSDQTDLQTALDSKLDLDGSNANQDIDIGENNFSAKGISITGIDGHGHIHLRKQSVDATTNANSLVIFADNNGDLKSKFDGLYYSTFKTSSNTADRIYTFPDTSGTVALTSDLGAYQPLATVLTNTTASFTTAQETKLSGIEAGAEVNTIDTVSDTSEIDLTITARVLSASIVAGSIDETKLDTSVNASLDLADTAVQPARSISTTAPLAGGGDLSANRTLSITQATTSTSGFLSSTDWNTFNNKQTALVSGTNIKTINGNSLLGSGDLSISASPAGSNTQIQYNNSGSFGASSNFTYDGTSLILGSGKSLKIGGGSSLAPMQVSAGLGSHGQSVIRDSSGAGVNSVHLLAFYDNADVRQGYIYKEASSARIQIKNEQATGTIHLTPNNASNGFVLSYGTYESYIVNAAILSNDSSGGGIGLGSSGSAGSMIIKPSTTGVSSGKGLGLFWNNLNVFGTNDFFFQGIPGAASTGMMIYEGYDSLATVFSNYSFSGGSSGYMVWAPQRTEKMRLTVDGKLGIGTTSPSYLLDVNGTANATAYRVGGTAGASGTFTTADAKTVTVTNGIITGIV